jgi:hypothetical protein
LPEQDSYKNENTFYEQNITLLSKPAAVGRDECKPLPDSLAFPSKALDLETLKQIDIMQAVFLSAHTSTAVCK